MRPISKAAYDRWLLRDGDGGPQVWPRRRRLSHRERLATFAIEAVVLGAALVSLALAVVGLIVFARAAAQLIRHLLGGF